MDSSGDYQEEEVIEATSDNNPNSDESESNTTSSSSSDFSIGTTHVTDEEYSLAFDLHLYQAIRSEDQDAKDIFRCAAIRTADSLFDPIHSLPHEMIFLQGNLDFQAEDSPFNGDIDAQTSHQIRMRKKREYFGTMQKMFPLGVSYSPSGRASSRAPSKANSKSPSKYSLRYGLKGAAEQNVSSGSNTPNEKLFPVTSRANVVFSTDTSKDSIGSINGLEESHPSPKKLTALLKKYEKILGIDTESMTARHSPSLQEKEEEENEFLANTIASMKYQELKRRLDITLALEKAEKKRLLEEKIQRKGNIKFKLRSLKDPTISLETEQFILNHQGNKRTGSIAIPTTAASVSDGSSSSSNFRKSSSLYDFIPSDDPTNPILQPEMTYRKEDYDGIDSEVLFFDKTGELLLGKNCLLVARKEKKDLMEDLYQQSLIEPKISLPTHPLLSSSSSSSGSHGINFPTPTPHNSPEKPLFGIRHGTRRRELESLSSPTKVSSSASGFSNMIPAPDDVQVRFEAFGKLEFQSQRTPLAKGVILKNITPESHGQNDLLSTTSFPHTPMRHGQLTAPAMLNEVKAPFKSPPKKTTNPNGTSGNKLSSLDPIAESKQISPEKVLGRPKGSSVSPSRVQTADATASSSSSRQRLTASSGRATTPSNGPSSPSGTGILPKNMCAGDKHLQNIRIRTPACRNRTSKKIGFDLTSYVEDFSMSTLDHTSENTLDILSEETCERSPSRMSPSSKKKYLREFPVLPPGQIRLVDNAQSIMNSPVVNSPLGHSFFMPSSSNARHISPTEHFPSSLE